MYLSIYGMNKLELYVQCSAQHLARVSTLWMFVVLANYNNNIIVITIASLTTCVMPGTDNVSINVWRDLNKFRVLGFSTVHPGVLDTYHQQIWLYIRCFRSAKRYRELLHCLPELPSLRIDQDRESCWSYFKVVLGLFKSSLPLTQTILNTHWLVLKFDFNLVSPGQLLKETLDACVYLSKT